MAIEDRANYLIELAKKHDWKCGAELGVWYGETFFRLLEALPDMRLIGVDDWRDNPRNVHHKDQRQNKDEVYKKALKYLERTSILDLTTADAAQLIPDNSLDFVFIDADHQYESVKADIKAWLPKVKTGGFLTGHDYDLPSVKMAVEELLGKVDCPKHTDYTWSWRKT